GHVSYMRISGWTSATQPLTSGRATQSAALESIVLLSGSPIVLTPNQGRWWLPIKSSGNATIADPLNLSGLAITPGANVTGITISSSTLIVNQGSGVSTFAAPTTRPTTMSLTRIPTTAPGTFSYAGSGSLILSGSPTP